jgi:hypothetical protein
MNKIIRLILHYPKRIVGLTLALTLFFAFFIGQIRFDNDINQYIPETNREEVFFSEIENIFGPQDKVFVELLSSRPEGVFNRETLQRIEIMSRVLEQLDYVDKVDSLALSSMITGVEGGMRVGPLWEEGTLEDDSALLGRIKNEAMSNPLFVNNLISRDGKAAGIILTLRDLPETESHEGGVSEEYRSELARFQKSLEEDGLLKEIRKEGEKTLFILNGKEKGEALTLALYRDGILGSPFFIESGKSRSFLVFSENREYFSLPLEDRVAMDIRKTVREIPGSEEIYYSGENIVNSMLGVYMLQDVTRLVPLVVTVVFLFLFLAFRKIRGVLFPLLSVLISTVWVTGLMGLLKVPLNQISVTLPVLLIGVGSAYGIHIINSYYEHLHEEETMPGLISKIMKLVGMAVVMAGVTTVIGFSSLTTSPMTPMQNFGVFTAIGIFFALAVNIFFVPSFLVLLPRPKKLPARGEMGRRGGPTFFQRFLRTAGESVYRGRVWILVLALIIVALSIWGISRMVIDTNTVEFFKKSSPVRLADEKINASFGGTSTLNLVIDGLAPDAMKDPDVLMKIEKIQEYAESLDNVGNTLSFVDFVKLMNKAMNDNDHRFFSVPDSQSLIAQYLFLYTTSGDPDDFSDVVDYNYQKANIFIQIRKSNTKTIDGIVRKVESYARTLFDDTQEMRGDVWVRRLDRIHELAFQRDVESYDLREVKRGLESLSQDPLLSSSPELADLMRSYQEYWTEDRKSGEETSSFSLIEVLNDADALLYGQLKEKAGTAALVRTGGVSKLYLVVNRLIIRTQISSIIMAALLVVLVVSLMFRSLAAGLLSVVPLLLAIVVNFGMMGFTGTKLDLATAIIASVAIGIGVDYAIHFLSRFHHVMLSGGDFRTATTGTMITAGRAIIFNMISVAAGFLVLCFSNFPPLQSAGWLIALTMLTSSLGALTLLPTLLNICQPKFLNSPIKEVSQ